VQSCPFIYCSASRSRLLNASEHRAVGGFLGLGEEEHAIPWQKLNYDASLGGYRTDIAEQQLRGTPSFYRDRDYEWSDRERERARRDSCSNRNDWVYLATTG